MGRFSNSTESMVYMAEYCDRCQNFRDRDDERGPGCPVWDLHVIGLEVAIHREDLELLIPTDGIDNLECTMFLPDRKEDPGPMFPGWPVPSEEKEG